MNQEDAPRDSATGGEARRDLPEGVTSGMQADVGGVPADVAAASESRPSGMTIPVLVVGLLLILLAHRGANLWWGYAGHLAYLAMVGALAWEALGRRSYEQMRRSYPQLTREWWVLNSLLRNVLPAVLLWLVLGLPALRR